MAKFTVNVNKGFSNTIIAEYEQQDLQSQESIQAVMNTQLGLMNMYDQANPKDNTSGGGNKPSYGNNKPQQSNNSGGVRRASAQDVMLMAGGCPTCGGDIVQKTGSYGDYPSCSNYSSCKTKPQVLKGVIANNQAPQQQNFQPVNQGQQMQQPQAPVAPAFQPPQQPQQPAPNGTLPGLNVSADELPF